MVGTRGIAVALIVGLAACVASSAGCGGDDTATTPADTSGSAGASGSGGSKGGAAGAAGSQASGGKAGTGGSATGGSGGSSDASVDTSGAGGAGGARDGGVGVGGAAGTTGGGNGGSGGASSDSGDARADDASDASQDALGAADTSNDGTVDSASDGGSPEEASVDGAPDVGSAADGASCVVGAMCAFGDAGGSGVLDNACVCQACASNDATGDAQCQAAYGPSYLCLPAASGRACTPGDCRTTNGAAPTCSGGQLCANDTCTPCATSADCTAAGAYGAGYVCANGACVQGNCVSSADCDTDAGATAGQLCGASNDCGQCSSDDQCAGDAYYKAAGRTLCDTSTHRCVGTTCAGNGPSACAGTHVCCGGVCQSNTTFSTANGPGKSCCGAGDCAGTGANSCTQSVCTACPAVQKNPPGGATGTYDFVVDPNDGSVDGGPVSDVGRSGADQTGCRFHTLTYALAFAGTYPNVGPSTPARVLLKADASANEAYPLNVPANVSIAGSTSGANPVLKVAAALDGVHLTGSNSGLSKLLIDGVNGNIQSAQRYARGIVVQGSGLSNVAIDHVTVQNSRLDGILVGGANGVSGALTINPGVVVQGAGFIGGATVRSSGVLVTGTGVLTINGGADPIAFNQNSQHGVSVTASGSVTVNATVDVSNPTASGYDNAPVVAIANDIAGLGIAQAPAGAATGASTVPNNAVTGFVSLRTAHGNGIRIEGGSKATLRHCVSYRNALAGVRIVRSNQAGTNADQNFITTIDLGTNGNPGNNVFQLPGQPFGVTPATGELPNGRAGICMEIAGNTGLTLNARGNYLVQSTNAEVACATASANTPVRLGNNCASPASTMQSIGIPTSVGFAGGAGTNAVDVANCVAQ